MKYSVIGLLAFLLLFTSCAKDGDDKQDYDGIEYDGNNEKDKDEGEGEKDDHGDDKQDNELTYKSDCFELIYPITYQLADGSTVTGNEEEIKEAIAYSLETNPEGKDKISLQFPVEIAFEHKDETISISSIEELKKYKKDCEGEKDKDEKEWEKEECFEFVFPVSFTFSDGTTITAEDENELEDSLKSWYTANPDSKEKPELQFPVGIVIDDHIYRVESAHQLDRYLEAFCKDKDQEEHDYKEICYELVYPLSYLMPDGTIITVDDAKETRLQFKEWYEAHPDSNKKPELQFPVEARLEDRDELVVINSQVGFSRLEEICKGNQEGEREDCFQILFPLSFMMPDGSIVTGANRDELGTLVEDWYSAHPDSNKEAELVFPVNISFPDRDAIIAVSSEEELQEFRAECDEDGDIMYDCPELEANIGDDCRDGTGFIGTINSDCECK